MIRALENQRQKNINYVRPTKDRHSCNNCYSTGFNPFEQMVFTCCYVCAGHGNVNWIDNITENQRRRDINEETHRACCLNNTFEALILLRGSLASLDIDFTFKMVGENEDGVKDIQKILDILEEHEMLQHHE